ncbi:MAG: sulfatase-like hydrolase/transferase [Acidobacteria bacterium]|nr:sulfatase-like hydrolase/transferase [Acidobacteriota bacterium]
MTLTRRVVVSAWLGLALAALFFYPLAAAVTSDIYYLQWQTTDVIETAVVLAALALACAGIVFMVWPRATRLATATLLLISVLPLASFAAGVSRQLPYEGALIAVADNRALGIGVSALMAVAGATAFVFRPAALGRWLRRLLVLVSPVSLVVLASLGASAARAGVVVQIDREPAVSAAVQRTCAPVLALLFDELSFSYLYDDDENVRTELPALGRLGARATHYLSVTAPGRETLDALPSFLAARRVQEIEVDDSGLLERLDDGALTPFRAAAPDGLFGTARRLGFRTEMAGYYLAYCEMLGGMVDTCRSRSFYNVSAPEEFSLVDPVRTTLVLWPRQFPFGLLKNPPFAGHQRELVDGLVAFARRPITERPPVFRFVHFSVPHLPFVFDADGYGPPFDPLRTSPDAAYVRQVGYVDRVVGELVAALERTGAYDRVALVVLADHGYRFGGRERDPLHIPFIVKRPGQTRREDVRAELHGEVLLRDVLEGACSSGP